MQRCIYCLQEKNVDGFRSKAHVISQMMGSFRPELYFANEMICKQCNNGELSNLERIFAEDSLEGLQMAMLDLKSKHTVRLRGERIKLTLTGADLGVFTRIFPTLKRTRGKIDVRPMFVLRNKSGGLQVLFIEAFSRLRPASRKYEEIRDWISKLPKDDMCIFATREFPVEKIIEMLSGIGVTYREKSRQTAESLPPDAKININVEGRIDDAIKRFVSMMAFNYFAFCARNGFRDQLYDTNFDAIRNFVLRGVVPRDGVIRLSEDPTLYNERGGAGRAADYQVSFLCIDRWIIAKVSLFGIFDYEVKIARYTYALDPDLFGFGCGHNFNPTQGTWLPLHGSGKPIVRADSFSLFRRE